MIVDVHTHALSAAEHLSEEFLQGLKIAKSTPVNMEIEIGTYLEAMRPVDRCIVFGMKARHVGFYVPNDWIAAFALKAPEKIIPFMSIDPTEDDFLDDFEHSRQELQMKGVKLAPMYAAFSPGDPRLDELYSRCAKHALPILFHSGTTFCRNAPLKFTYPGLWDEVAMRHPDTVMVLAHLGHPFEGEALVTTRKHPNLYLDLSALYYRPWQLYNSLILAQEYGVTHKILFGTDYPFGTPQETLDGLRGLNKMVEGTNLPRVSSELLEEIIHRDSLGILGLD